MSEFIEFLRFCSIAGIFNLVWFWDESPVWLKCIIALSVFILYGIISVLSIRKEEKQEERIEELEKRVTEMRDK